MTSTAHRVTLPAALRGRLVPPLLDALLAAAFVALTTAEAVASPTVPSPREHLVVAGLAMASLAWRRSFPLTVALLVVAANTAINHDNQFSTLLSLVLVSFTVGSETEGARSYAGLAVVLVPFMAGMVVEGLEPSDVAAALVFLVGPWWVGGVFRLRADRAREAVERVAQLERDRVAEAARAAEEERTRIARELHDIVSHSISVITIQTQAVRRRLGPDHAAEAADLALVEATAREALAEMRRLFGVLRADGESLALAPQPGLAELGRLVEQAGSGATKVVLRVEGRPVDLPPGVDLAAYRIAQEGLTNALRHAEASEVEVVVRYAPTRLDIEVCDDGRGLDDDPGVAGAGGHGLVGIRERVALYGGSVGLTTADTGGVRLEARLPIGDPS